MNRDKLTFMEYRSQVEAYIIDVQKILAEMLGDDPAFMEDQARRIEVHASRIDVIHAKATSYLSWAEYDALEELKKREEKSTEVERKTFIAAQTALEARFQQTLHGMLKCISQRVSLVQSILSYSKAANIGFRQS